MRTPHNKWGTGVVGFEPHIDFPLSYCGRFPVSHTPKSTRSPTTGTDPPRHFPNSSNQRFKLTGCCRIVLPFGVFHAAITIDAAFFASTCELSQWTKAFTALPSS